MNTSQDPAQIIGYDVTDDSGNKIGKVDNVWVDDVTNELEFVGVKTGWLMGKTHVIPVANARIADGSIRVPFDEDTIKTAPSFNGDEELTPEQEDEIYSYYGEGQPTSESSSGLPADAGTGSA
jgi:sporulation protein YlmC with PRC-barrel domain